MDRSQSAATDNPTPPEKNGTAAGPLLSASALRFAAPDHVAAITLSTGREIRVENGVLTAPRDLTHEERRQIERAGFATA